MELIFEKPDNLSILFTNAKRKRCTRKMLKETETKETIRFFATVLS